MIAAPAVDLRGGRCVQLVGGRPEDERVSLPDPGKVAERWWSFGFETLHLVDLDAALGDGDQEALLLELASRTPATTQVGGGIRDTEKAMRLLDGGLDRIIVGTRAIDDPAWLESLCARAPHRVMVAADVRDGVVLRRGWTEESALQVVDFLAALRPLPLAGVLCTDVAKEGRVEGIDRTHVEEVVAASSHPMWISGGISTHDDLVEIDRTGAAGAVMGMALYTEALDAASVAEEWGSE